MNSASWSIATTIFIFTTINIINILQLHSAKNDHNLIGQGGTSHLEHFFSLYLRMQRFDFENSEMIKNHNFCSSQIFFKNGEMMKNVINFSDFLPRTLPPFPLTHHLWRRREQGSSSKSALSWLGSNCSLDRVISIKWMITLPCQLVVAHLRQGGKVLI